MIDLHFIALSQSPASVAALLVLLLVFGVSLLMFYLLERRWTQHRGWIDLSEWAETRDFKIRGRGKATVPTIVGSRLPLARAQATVEGKRTTIVRVETSDEAGEVFGMNLLVQQIEGSWPTTALRPMGAPRSVVDAFALSSFPTLAPPERFAVYGTESTAARRLARSMIRGLLPADVGFVLEGKTMMLEFSGRPMDAIEAERMLRLALQLVGRLPSLKKE